MSQPTCILCAFYYPQTKPHLPDMSQPGRQTCDAGLRRLEHELLNIRSSFARLGEQEQTEAGANDPVSRRLPVAPVAPVTSQPHVSGSPEPRLPININRADLLLPVVPGYVTDPYGDQRGLIPVAAILNEWVAEWHDRWFSCETYPQTDAITLINWILGVRLMYAVHHEPAIAEFAEEMRTIRGTLRAVLGESAPRPVIMWGIACPSCKLISQLKLDPDNPDHRRECGNCGLLLSREEYLQHLRDLVDAHRRQQDVAHG